MGVQGPGYTVPDGQRGRTVGPPGPPLTDRSFTQWGRPTKSVGLGPLHSGPDRHQTSPEPVRVRGLRSSGVVPRTRPR